MMRVLVPAGAEAQRELQLLADSERGIGQLRHPSQQQHAAPRSSSSRTTAACRLG